MKIIRTDNFDREHISDALVAENVSTYFAPIIADFLNERFGGERSDDFFAAVPDDYKLYKFEP